MGDMFDDIEDEDEESESFSADDAGPKPAPVVQQTIARVSSKRPRRIRTRPMTPPMISKFPDVVTIIMTKANGTQTIFVKD